MNIPAKMDEKVMVSQISEPPIAADLVNIACREEVISRKRKQSDLVSNELVNDITKKEHAVVQALNGSEVAPAWFAPALEAALAPALESALAPALAAALAPIFHRLDSLDNKLDNIYIRQINSYAVADDDVITPLRSGDQTPPATFPTTLGEIKILTVQDMHPIERYYNLDIEGSVDVRRKRIARAYGARLTTLAYALL